VIFERRSVTGPNELERHTTSALSILKRQFASPFIYLLLAAAAVALATGESADAAMIVLFTAINTGLGFTQEFHAERAVRSLLGFWRGRAHVVRDGQTSYVETRELVTGDLIRLQAGDTIPADVRFVSARGLLVDESVLTGESIQVPKSPATSAEIPTDWFGASNIGFSGTAVVSGEAEAVVFATGRSAALGEIAALAAETKTASAFEKEIGHFSVFIMKLVSVTLVLMLGLNVVIKGLGRIEELLLFSIALTVGVIPEALPVVTTIALSRGALRMASKRVIVKRLSAINDLGSIDILCTDKTGTITENSLQVSDIRASDPDECLRYGLLGSSFLGEHSKQSNNSFDLALWERAGVSLRKEALAAIKLAEDPFDPIRRRNAALLEAANGRVAVLRGAPDEIIPRCADAGDLLALGKWIGERGLAGHRVLAIAAKAASDATALDDADGWRLLGVIAFHDPIKQSAYDAVRKAAELGVRIKILTGDSREVAGAVAAKLGLINDPLKTITGAEFEALSAEAQHAALEEYQVFARMNPKQKFSVLALLQEKNSVGFLGEGFNDAPGLKLANVGLAVEGASDVSKEAADVILQGKSLAVIFDGIEEGRRTFANIHKYLKITLASNFGNFYSVAVSSFFIPYLPMLPLLNLLTVFPMIAIAADRADAEDLKKPSHHDSKNFVFVATVLGIVSSAFDFAAFAAFRRFGEGPLQTMWFMVSALTELALIYSLRSSRRFWKAPRPPLAVVLLSFAAAVAAIALPFTEFGAAAFGFERPTMTFMRTAAIIVITYLIATETVKIWLRPSIRGGSASAN
jgi:Mg2+-importing ATPase